jgi:hypothetical protein
MGMNARQLLSNIIAKAGARNYGARAGETIAGNLVRGANGKFAAGGGAAPDTESADPKEVASVLKRLLAASKPAKAAKGGKGAKPKAPPKAKKPPKPKKDEVKVGRGRDAAQDAKRAEIISKLPIPAADKATLTSIINGEKVKSGALSGLVKAGLVQVRGDGSFELTGIANALARAKESDMGKFDSAKRALKRAYAAIKSAEAATEEADDEVIVETFDVEDDDLSAIAGVLGVSYAKEIDGAMSFEQISRKVSSILQDEHGTLRPDGSRSYVWIIETYLTEVIAELAETYYRIGYSVDRDGNVTVEARDKWVQVERVSSWQEVAKGDIDADDEAKPLAFVASGAFGPDSDGEWMSEAMLESVAKAVNDGKLPMTVDIWHVGFPSGKNPKPKSEPVIVGSVAKAEVINKHLVLTPTFADANDEAVVRAAKDDLQLSVYFAGAISKGNDGAINGTPSRASVAILPRGKAAYKYSAVLG